MIGLLEDILCFLEQMAAAIVGLLVIVVNAAIVGIGAFIGVLIELLPVIPEAPAIPENGALGMVNFLIPIGPDLIVAASLFGMFAVFMGVRLALNWMRAL